jgi:hypothetical protein
MEEIMKYILKEQHKGSVKNNPFFEKIYKTDKMLFKVMKKEKVEVN